MDVVLLEELCRNLPGVKEENYEKDVRAAYFQARLEPWPFRMR